MDLSKYKLFCIVSPLICNMIINVQYTFSTFVIGNKHSFLSWLVPVVLYCGMSFF
jgi:hypothetical protein